MYYRLIFFLPILQRNDEEAVVDRGGTRSILKTHFEKEDLEGKTFLLSLGQLFLKCFKKNVKFVTMWRIAKVDIRVDGGGGWWIYLCWCSLEGQQPDL